MANEFSHFEETDDRIERFVESFLARDGNCPCPTSVIPPDMKGEDSVYENYQDWIAIPSPVRLPEIEELESDVGATLPPLFKKYFMYKCILYGNTGVIEFPCIRSDDPLGEIYDYVNIYHDNVFWSDNQLFPFAWFSDDRGYACLDLKQIDSSGDRPVVFVDYEEVIAGSTAREVRWTSFRAMLDFIQDRMEWYDQFNQ